MKKILFIALLISISAATFGQQNEPSAPLTKQDYLQKSKSQRTSAFILLGSGITALAIAAPGKISLGVAPTLIIGGGIAIVGSIPLFIAAGKNKRRAMSMSFKNETVPLPQPGGFASKPVPSFSIKFNL